MLKKKWLSGFIDAEGNFQVFFDRQYLRVLFRINLHVDDIEVLYAISKYLGVGSVRIQSSYGVYSIGKVKDLITVLIPLLDKHSLRTTKYLDYIDFKKILQILSSSPSTKLSGEDLTTAKLIIAGMNSTRSSYDYSKIHNLNKIDPYWLLGLIEGEGTFGFRNLVPYFQLGLHSRNLSLLKTISSYLSSLPNGFCFTLNSPAPKVSITLNKRTNVTVIVIANVDALYDYLAMFLLDMPFQSRKSTDFYYWCLAVYFHKIGHFYTPNGRALVLTIANFVNKARYSTASVPVITPSLESIKQVLSMKLPITITPELNHLQLSQKFARLVKNRTIWLYDNGLLVKGSPFNTHATAAEAAGLPKNTSVIKRYIDTGKLFNNRYTFYSTAQFELTK